MGILVYLLANTSYTVAVFTDPGSPLAERRGRSSVNRHGYSHLPTTELTGHSSLTVSSSGGSRYCKKCQCVKPDRTHHCSTCKRCVLKMDHHCPWLATCVGFYNYKAFLLFIVYTSLFCWICFAVSGTWVWYKVLNDARFSSTEMPINVVMLAVISGIIGLVLSGFTAWHISLATRGLTTIECLEKARYLAPIHKTFDRERFERQHEPHGYSRTGDGPIRQTINAYGQQLLDIHANAIPRVTRVEEGEERLSPVTQARQSYPDAGNSGASNEVSTRQPLRRSYSDLERERERDRYEEYLDECEDEKLPNPFDLGWRLNLLHLLGEKPLLWFLPVCNTLGDGWRWEPSAKFLDAKQRVDHRRYERWLHINHHKQSGPSIPPPHGSLYHPDQQPRLQQGDFFRTLKGRGHKRSDDYTRPDTGVSMKTLAPVSRHKYNEQSFDLDRYSTSSDDTQIHHEVSASKQEMKHGDQIAASSGTRNSEEEWRDWE